MKIKQIFDFSFAFIGLLISIPIFIFVSVLVKLSSTGPVIYKQKRVGQNGKLFVIYKFRTMYVNNELNTMTVKGDSRITSVGKILRKYKIDELPELWNILKGDMSFVGPRPDVPGYADLLKDENRNVLKLKPGITGPATLKYANEEEILASIKNPSDYYDKVIFPDKTKLNLDYYYNWSLWKDLKIIFFTIFRKY